MQHHRVFHLRCHMYQIQNHKNRQTRTYFILPKSVAVTYKALKFLIIQFIPGSGICRLRNPLTPVTSQNHSQGSGILGRGSFGKGRSGFGGCIKRDLFIMLFMFFSLRCINYAYIFSYLQKLEDYHHGNVLKLK